MVVRILSLFCLLLMATAASAAGVKTRLDHPTLALGEPLTLTLTGAALEQIDLAPLAADFEVRGRTLSRSGDEETLVLTLYPLREGRLNLPTLQAGAARTRPAGVTVTAGSADMPQVLFRVETDPAAPIQRQPTRLTLEACDDGSLDWKRPPLPLHAALYHRPLGEEQRDVERDGVRCTAHRWHWMIIPTQAGPLQLPLPMLEAGKFGRQLRFPAPAAAFTVAAVPAWLPLNVAIGQPRLTLEKRPATWPVNRPLAWRFEVVGGYSEEGLKALLALQLLNQPGFNTYAPTLEALPGEDRNSPLTLLRVTLYADVRETGALRLPTLTLPWFDPANGRLESLAVAGGQVQIVNPARESLTRWLTRLLAVALLAALCAWAARRLAWRWWKRRGLMVVATAADMETLSRAVRGFSLRRHSHPAATLGIWRERLLTEARCEGLDELIEALERVRYGEAPGDFTVLRARVLRVLGGCRRALKSGG
ncbi:MAG: hypothetical protein PHD37_13830 [Gallionellaceae bacterium]|nr:hypothetical protein [Gallionellaceae bacterium]